MQSFFFIHLNKQFIRINLHDIKYVEALAHHVKIYTDHGNFIHHLSLKQLETKLPMDLFARVNRSTLVPLQRIVSFDKDTAFLKDKKFSFTDKYKKEFEEKVTILLHQENNAGKTPE